MTLELRCPQCNQLLRVGDDAQGKRVRCPKCQTVFEAQGGASLPAASTPSSTDAPLGSIPTSPANPPPANPFSFPSQASPRPTATPNPFTTPAPSPNNPFNAPVTPTPGANPFACPPTTANPFAGPASGSFGGGAPSPFAPPKDVGNPYASPAVASYSPPGQFGNEGARIGLPWDVPGPNANTFLETAKLVMLSPTEAFNRMQVTGQLGNAILYYFLGQVLAQIGLMLWYVPLMIMQEGPEAGPQLIGNVIGGVVGGIIGLFLAAAFAQLGLMLVGGAKQPYETTLRVLAYCSGSISWLNVVPIAGPIIVGIWYLVAAVVGLSETHRCGVGKALFAIFFPLIVCCVLGAGLGLVIAIAVNAR